VLPNNKKLSRTSFLRYFEKKVLYTVRKFNMLRKEAASVKKESFLNSKVLLHLLEKSHFPLAKKSNIVALNDCTDDIASLILESWFKTKSQEKLAPHFIKNKIKFIRPFYLITEKEIEIYAKLKGIKGKLKKKTKARILLDRLEQFHPEIKRATLSSYSQLLKAS